MKLNGRFLSRLPEGIPGAEALPPIPIVELAGCRRVLVENHLGVIQYSPSQIGIKMKYGQLTVCGCRLTLEHMTKVKLVITGQIDSLSLARRNER